MAGHPKNIQEVGLLVDLGTFAVTAVATPVSATSRVVMSVFIQNQGDNTVYVGDSIRQSVTVAAAANYTVKVGDAANVYYACALGETSTVAIHIIEPPGG